MNKCMSKFIEVYKENNHSCIRLYHLKIKIRKYSIFEHFKNLINIYISIRLINLKHKYRIIPIGQYCLPRVITTFSNIKPTKSSGELSCPFDLAFFNSFDDIIRLLDTRFSYFYEDLSYNDEKQQWENKSINAIFNHDGMLSKEDFISRYAQRINNIYTYMSETSRFKYFLFATFQEIPTNNLNRLLETLTSFCPNNEYRIIIINQSKKKLDFEHENIYIINQSNNTHRFRKINKNGDWVGELRRCNCFDAFKIYSDISLSILKTILESLSK